MWRIKSVCCFQYFIDYKLGGDENETYQKYFLSSIGFASQIPNLLLNLINVFAQCGGGGYVATFEKFEHACSGFLWWYRGFLNIFVFYIFVLQTTVDIYDVFSLECVLLSSLVGNCCHHWLILFCLQRQVRPGGANHLEHHHRRRYVHLHHHPGHDRHLRVWVGSVFIIPL